jgi:NAD(P)-dependent dehydrogenase (short-subunit alcohol dehydrogenase family)
MATAGDMSFRKCALVTAGSAGLGAAIARVLVLELGMNVTINYSSNADRAETLVRDLTEQARAASHPNPAPTVRVIQADLTKRSEIERLVEAAAAGFGRLDVVISNFGWTRMRTFADLDDGVDEDDWDRCFEANVKAPLWLFHVARPWLEASNAREAGAAVFVGTASVAGCKPSGSSLVRVPLPTYACVSSTCSHGIAAICRHEGGPGPSRQVPGCHCGANNTSEQRLAGGIADGESLGSNPRLKNKSNHLQDWGLTFPPDRLAAVKEANRLGRFATVEDVAEQVRTFVVSKSVTGQNAIIDAGFSL